MRYPEIYDIENFESWKTKFLRKEVLSREWDLMSYEVCPDVFEIPIFSDEYCNKLVRNLTNVDVVKLSMCRSFIVIPFGNGSFHIRRQWTIKAHHLLGGWMNKAKRGGMQSASRTSIKTIVYKLFVLSIYSAF